MMVPFTEKENVRKVAGSSGRVNNCFEYVNFKIQVEMFSKTGYINLDFGEKI